MTTIAYRAGVIAADRMMGGWQSVDKLLRLKDGCCLAGCGRMDDLAEVGAWLMAGAKKDAKPDIERDESEFLLVHPNGDCYWLSTPFLRQVKVNDEYIAVGSGARYALGAMAAGASAKRAVEIACRFDPHTGKGVNVMRVKK